MNLVLFTTTSHLLEHLALESIRLHETVIVDTDDQVHKRLTEIGISSIGLRSPGDRGWGERDSAFAKLAMPGLQLQEPFAGTNLPMWKVMSIDRLNFWYRGKQAKNQYESIMALEWDKALVPLDMHNPLPLALARHSGRKVVGVQVSTLRTREWYDLLSAGIGFDEWKVGQPAEQKWLSNFGIQSDLIQIEAEPKTETPSKESRKAMRKALNVPEGYKVGLVFFDSQCEWEFRQLIPTLNSMYQLIYVYPLHPYDLRNLQDLNVIGGQMRIADNISIETICDEAILMRLEYNLSKGRTIPVRIFDITGRFLSKELSS